MSLAARRHLRVQKKYPYIGMGLHGYAYSWDWTAMTTDFNSIFNGLAIVRTFNDTIGTWSSGLVGATTSQSEATVHHSFKTWDTTSVTNWIVNKPYNGKTAWLTYKHEPENDGWNSTQIQDWKDKTAQLVAIRNASGRTDIRIVTTLMDWTLNPASGRDFWGDWYVPEVDAYFWDAYNGGSNKIPPYYSDPITKIMPRIKDVAQITGKNWGIGEFGSWQISTDTDDSGRADWIKKYMDACIADGRCEAICYWSDQVYHWEPNDTDPNRVRVVDSDHMIQDSLPCIAAYTPYCVKSRLFYSVDYPPAT